MDLTLSVLWITGSYENWSVELPIYERSEPTDKKFGRNSARIILQCGSPPYTSRNYLLIF